ncbi:MAG: prepilin-type N-terminal cleavage/methylation domain-containing protein [Nitrospiraceae bacterium]|nr:prepilin-type N-terminal cleavage/methylation domain-containing protein [Nitrospiraceae bacterium]
MISRSKQIFVSSRSGQSGFTLLELILVLLLMALAVSIAAVSAGRIYENTVFRDSLRGIEGALARARLSALAGRTPIVFRTDGESFWLVKDGQICRRRVWMPRGTGLESKDIVFFPKGDSSGGKIKVTDSRGKEYLIEVDTVTGHTKLQGP